MPLVLTYAGHGPAGPSLQARNGSTTKKLEELGARAAGMAQALSIGDDVILACGEKGNCDGRVWHSLDMLRNCN